MGLEYLHDQEVIHGDLKGVRLSTYHHSAMCRFMLTRPRGQYSDKPQWPRLHCRLRSTYDHPRPCQLCIHNLVLGGWHNLVDEPRASQSGIIWFEGQPPDEGIGLLRTRDGGV